MIDAITGPVDAVSLEVARKNEKKKRGRKKKREKKKREKNDPLNQSFVCAVFERTSRRGNINIKNVKNTRF